MRKTSLPLVCLCVGVALLSSTDRANAQEAPGQVTLPLPELLELYRLRDAAPSRAAAPVGAILESLDLRGRLFDDGVTLAVSATVVVLEDRGWVEVPLFSVDDTAQLSEISTAEHAKVAILDGRAVVLTDAVGTHRLTMTLRKAAALNGHGRRVSLAVAAPQVSRLAIRHDDSLFRLRSAGVLDGDAWVLAPAAGRFDIAWESRGVSRAAAPTARPPVETKIERAHGHLVSTLDGRRVLRMAYDVRVGGAPKIGIRLPKGAVLEKTFVNGASVAATPRDERLEVTLTPARAGEESARLELVLGLERVAFLLSGELQLMLPEPELRVDALFVSLSLPETFTYEWSGGTMAAADAAPEPGFTHEMPEPGRRLYATQLLVGAPADVRLAYRVDLTSHYFR